MSLFFTIAERGLPIPVTREQLTLYAGPSQIIATALMFRLFRRALADLSPDGPPERTDISVLTAFPGPGVMDCIEYVTRARTYDDGRFTIDDNAGPEAAPIALIGRFYFEIRVGSRGRGYWPAEGYFTEEFRAMVRAWQDGHGSPEEEAAYQDFKQQLVGRLLGAPEDKLFHWREIA